MTATPAVHRRMRVAAAVTSIGVLVTSTVGYAAVQRYSGQVSLVDAGTERRTAAEHAGRRK